jgi:hypothetical protein
MILKEVVRTTKPLCIDLFCGLGGWAEGFLAEGYDVIGYDIDPRFAEMYPATFIQADVRDLDGREFRGARCIVASPPCQGFSLANAQVRRKERPTEADWQPVRAVWRIAEESGVPTILENVRGALQFLGPARASWGSRYLWGDVPPYWLERTNEPEKFGGSRWWPGKNRPRAKYRRPELTAKIPLPLARAVARGFL